MAKKKETENVTGEQMNLDKDTQDRLSRAGFVPVGGGGDIQKWEIGKSVEGQFCGVRKGKMGYLFSVQTAPGMVEVWGCPKGLQPRIEELPLGTEIFVACVGTKPSDYNNDMWVFEVFAKPIRTA